MKRSGLIRLGGLVTMLCGALYALERYRSSLEAGLPFVMLLVAAMVGTGSVAFLLQSERYGWPGASASLVSSAGLVLILVGNQIINSVTGSNPLASWGFTVFVFGLLAIVTTNARLLPWWCGVALVAGSPFGVLLLMMLPSMFSESLLEGPWQLAVEALVGVPWCW